MGGIEKGYCEKERVGTMSRLATKFSHSLKKRMDTVFPTKRMAELSFFFFAEWDANPIKAHPRWFRVGDPLTDVETQHEIVEELMGEMMGLP